MIKYNYNIIAVCQNCKKEFQINKYYYNRRKKLNKIFCKKCSYLLAAKNANYQLRHEKSVNTCLQKYNVDNPAKLEESNKKRKITNLKKYGEENYGCYGSKSFNENIKRKYNVNNVSELSEVTNKRQNTLKTKTGFKHALQVSEYKEKAELTCIKRHGHSLQECTLGTISNNRLIFNNLKFDSLWEVSYWIYCKLNNIDIIRNQGEYYFEYFDKNNKIHKYYPDFYLPKLNKFIEIKGDFFINENGYILDYKTKKPNMEKTHCVKTHAEILTSKELKILGVKLYTKKEIEQLEMIHG